MPRTIRYASDPDSLFFPWKARDEDFFPLGNAVSEAALCAEMSRVAYIKHEDTAGGRERLARILGKVGFAVPNPSFHFNAGGTQGFVADGRTREGETVRVIAFRGTEPDDRADLIADLDFLPDPWPAGGRVHSGFEKAFGRVADKVKTAMTNGPDRVLVTGHSLGAALATLAASVHQKSRLYTFGSPRVGNAEFAKTISRERHSRYVDHIDAVTTVPIADVLGYAHLEPAIYIDADGMLHPDLTDSTIVALQNEAHSRGLNILAILKQIKDRALLMGAEGIPLKDLTDHAPFNYVSALMSLK